MNSRRRIFLNVIASYGRSLFSLIVGLLCGRWTLNALGEVDYGLFGAVGCLVFFIGFFNSIMIGGATRFYAISIGQSLVAEDKASALEESRRWFNTSLTIETVFPFILFLIGYPIGEWAVRCFMTIPADRIETCVWVFRCSCLSAFTGMICCPFNAMYQAKQYIAELTVYSFITGIIQLCIARYMVTHPRDNWLLPFSIYTCLAQITPNVIIAIRARHLFPECRIVLQYMWDLSRLKTTLKYTGCIVMGAGSSLLKTQGMTILINKMYGPKVNASMTIANNVNSQSSSLSAALMNAFSPAITTTYGSGDYKAANFLTLRACKFALILSLLFTLPLSLELPEVMVLWLKNPPQHVNALCWLMILYYLVDVCTTGHMIAVNAHGQIFWYNLILSSIGFLTLPIALIAAILGCNVQCCGWALVVMGVVNSIGRVLFAHHYVGLSIRYWLMKIILPTGFLVIVCGGIGYLPHWVMGESFLRVCVTSIITETFFIPLVWLFIFDHGERKYVKEVFSKIVSKLKGEPKQYVHSSL